MKRFEVVGIGNALVDVLAQVDEAFLERAGITMGVMECVDMARSQVLYGQIGPAREISGGSAANTIAGIAQLGGRAAYVGRVKDDQLGEIFAHDLCAQGATYETAFAPKDADYETGRSIVLVTPNGERSMSTYLGASEFLSCDDIDPQMMADTQWLYLEGYRFDGPDSHAAFAKATKACKAAGGRVSIALSDPFCVERHRDAFRAMLREDVDLLFCERGELLAMYQVDDLEKAKALAAQEVELVVCTDGRNGAYVLSKGNHWHLPAVPATRVDTTGAGDLFAGAFLWGLVRGYDLPVCGQMGNVAAGEIISHIGARSEADLSALLREHGLL